MSTVLFARCPKISLFILLIRPDNFQISDRTQPCRQIAFRFTVNTAAAARVPAPARTCLRELLLVCRGRSVVCRNHHQKVCDLLLMKRLVCPQIWENSWYVAFGLQREVVFAAIEFAEIRGDPIPAFVGMVIIVAKF